MAKAKPENIKKSGMNEIHAGNESSKKSPIHKKPIFWLISFLSLILLGIIIFLSSYFYYQNKNRQVVNNGWNDIINESNLLSDLGGKIQDQQTFDTYNSELKKFNEKLDSKKSAAKNLSFPGSDVKRYQNFLADYSNYVGANNNAANNIKDFSQEDSDKLKDLASGSRSSADELKNNTKYLNSSMPASAFQIQDALLQANKAILENELTSKTKQIAQAAATAKDAADKLKVETLSNNFLNAYLAGNAPLMRQYMTEGFQKEYDYNQLTSSSRSYVYPASFRILSIMKIDDNNYKVQANVLFRSRDGSSQYTLGQELNNIFDSSSSKWLVNSIREGNSF